jgi:hypothetical protein
MIENYCQLVNITNSILLYTSVNYNSIIDCKSNNISNLCISIDTTFRNIKVLPIYKKVIEILYISLHNTLDCTLQITNQTTNQIPKSMLRGFNTILKTEAIHTYDICKLLFFVIIINTFINRYKNTLRKNK